MKLPRRSLLWRIILLHMAAVVALSIALPISVRVLLRSTADTYERNRLIRHEAELAKALHHTPQGWRLDLSPNQLFVFGGGNSFFYAILDGHGVVHSSSMPDHGALFPLTRWSGQPVFEKQKRDGALYFGATFQERRDGASAWVQIAQDLDNPDVISDDIVDKFLDKLVWVIVPILALLVMIDFINVRRALEPVLEASELAKAIGPASLSLRLPSERLPDEIAPLAQAVNEALDRLEAGFRTQREFTADAAHELRTPLAVLRLRMSALADKSVAEALAADIDVMARIIGQLLEVAELETFVADPGQVADLRSVGSRAVAYLAPLAAANGRKLALTAPSHPCWVFGEEEMLFHAVRNLVENAISHAPSGTDVEVKIEPQGVMRVLDRGPGIKESERDLVFQRFWRRERSTSGGAGLGLAIVARIIQAHGGEVSVRGRAGGGAAFIVRLKPASSPIRNGDQPPADRAHLQPMEIDG